MLLCAGPSGTIGHTKCTRYRTFFVQYIWPHTMCSAKKPRPLATDDDAAANRPFVGLVA